MKISLNDIPAEGRTYHFDRQTGELNEILADLIEQRPYDVDFTIRPLGNAFELKGNVTTNMRELCSRCGWDIEFPIRQAFYEILMEDQEEYRKSKSVHGNQSVDYAAQGPDVTFYQHDTFNAGEFVHEAIALSQPFYPTCSQEKCENLAEVEARRQQLAAEFAKADESQVGHPAFAVLKNFGSGSSQNEPKN